MIGGKLSFLFDDVYIYFEMSCWDFCVHILYLYIKKLMRLLIQVMMRPMFGAFGKAASSNSIAFVSKASYLTCLSFLKKKKSCTSYILSHRQAYRSDFNMETNISGFGNLMPSHF